MPGVHTCPGGNASTNGWSSASNARSSLAKIVVSPRRAQYSGLIPIGSRATAPRPSVWAIANANMPRTSYNAAEPSRSTSRNADSVSESVAKRTSESTSRMSSWL